MNCSRGDVVLLPIPFTDLTSRKVRPAVVVGRGTFPGDLFVVPLTSQLEQSRLRAGRLKVSRRKRAGGVKAQLATIESKLVLRIVGRLSPTDSGRLDELLRRWLQL